MKVIKIKKCDDCPFCEFYDGWHNHDDVCVCEDRQVIIEDIGVVDGGCALEDQKEQHITAIDAKLLKDRKLELELCIKKIQVVAEKLNNFA